MLAVVLAPRYLVPTTTLFRYTIAAFAASAIAPARAGELIRVWALKKRDGVPVADCAAVAVTEKLLDVHDDADRSSRRCRGSCRACRTWVGRAMFVCGAVALGDLRASGSRSAGSKRASRALVRALHRWHARVRSPRRLLLAASH